MDQIEDSHDLEREIERASRLASGVTDQTTYEWLKQFVEELKQRLQERIAARRANERVRARAKELGDQRSTGRPRFGVLVAGGAGTARGRSPSLSKNEAACAPTVPLGSWIATPEL
jgi:hypothetical protein